MKKVLYTVSAVALMMSSQFVSAQQPSQRQVDPSKVQSLNSSPQNIKIQSIKGAKNDRMPSSIVTKESMYPNMSEEHKSQLVGYDITPGGLFYKYITRGNSTKIANPSDFASIHVEYKIGDSLIFTTKNLNPEGEPVMELLKSPKYRGDVNEGLLMMKPGDQMEFKYFTDSLAAHTRTQLPPYVKPGAFSTWTITMFDLKTKKEHDEEINAHKNEQIIKDEKLILEHFKKNNIKNFVKSPSGVYIVYQEEGFNDSPVKGQKVTVNYTGKLLDGKVFDSNVDPKFNHVQPFTFTLLANQVIKGWDEGVSMMRKNSKATLYIPSPLAYGNKSHGPDIPANSILVFDIEVLDYK